MKRVLSVIAISVLSGCIGMVPRRDFDALNETVDQQRAQLATLHGDLDALRARLEHALTANADVMTSLATERDQRGALGGRLDELGHAFEEFRREHSSRRAAAESSANDVKRDQAEPSPSGIGSL